MRIFAHRISPENGLGFLSTQEFVVDGVRKVKKDYGGRWIGIQKFDKETGDYQLLEGIKEKGNGNDSWERGKFQYIEGLKRWELVEGVKCVKGNKIRAKWIYDANKNEMKGVKMVKKCGLEKCERNSEKSRRVFRLCGKCKNVFYCSRRHQRNDWQDHKYVRGYY